MEARSKAVQATGWGDELSQLKRRFDQWRAERKVGQRILQDLWADAVVAATECGAYRVSAELHLDYNVLKRRAALAGGKAPGTELTPRFVELFAAPGATKSATSLPQCVVEIDNARGAKMRVHMHILVAVEPIDFRAGIDALVGACRKHLQGDPFSGALFVFRNRARTAIKVLVYEGQGFWMCHKRLFSGRFTWWPDGAQPGRALQACELQVLLMAGDPSQARAAPALRALSLAA